MSDAASLRSLLTRTDASAPAIQATAGAMMKHYDKSAGVAVVEWRNALHQARNEQHLPLLYVANEVLQNSKRNRGNKFLEAFSPVLGQSLIFIAQRGNVEKVRRTVKIWGDRHVFSIRFINELLRGLDPYRMGGSQHHTVTSSNTSTSTTGTSKNDGSNNPRFSPQTNTTAASGSSSSTTTGNTGVSIFDEAPSQVTPASTTSPTTRKKVVDIDQEMARIDDSSNDGDDAGANNMDDGGSDDDGDLFGDTGDGVKLDIQVDLDKAAAATTPTTNDKSSTKTGVKRRRSSTGSTSSAGGGSGSGSRRRSKVLSTSSLSELWTHVSSLQQGFDHCQAVLAEITRPDYANVDASHIETLVGDELLQSYKQVQEYEKRVNDQRRELHRIATKRKALEQEAVRYLPWLESTLKQDEEDIEFCNTLEGKIQLIMHVHGPARAARDEQLQEEARRRQEEAERDQRKQEEEERKKFMESAMKKETEAKPGMVWNKAMGEYVYLQTDESWRD